MWRCPNKYLAPAYAHKTKLPESPLSMEINAFLEGVHERLCSSEIRRVVVTGNDSADLDSIVSSLLFAYLSSKKDPNTLYIPLVKVSQADIELRPEVTYVLNRAGVHPEKLVCIDHVDLSAMDPCRTNTRVILVDHNRLTPPFTPEWDDCVAGILDHHVDEGCYLSAPQRLIVPVGSCTSLVVLEFPDAFKPPLSPLSQLALGPILVDTIGLRWEFGKMTKTDEDAYRLIMGDEHLNAASSTNDLYESIERVKCEVTHLCSRDLLRKDYKEFALNGFRVGTSSVAWHLAAWVSREPDGVAEIIRTTEAWIDERHLDLEVVLTSFDHGDHYERELAVVVRNDKLLPIKEALEHDISLGLSFQPFQPKDNRHVGFYHQANVKMSRKQVWPFIQSLIQAIPA